LAWSAFIALAISSSERSVTSGGGSPLNFILAA